MNCAGVLQEETRHLSVRHSDCYPDRQRAGRSRREAGLRCVALGVVFVDLLAGGGNIADHSGNGRAMGSVEVCVDFIEEVEWRLFMPGLSAQGESRTGEKLE